MWTYVFDVSGVASVLLYIRSDQDGVNPLDDFANEVGALRICVPRVLDVVATVTGVRSDRARTERRE